MPEDYTYYVEKMASFVNGRVSFPSRDPEECMKNLKTYEYKIFVDGRVFCRVPAMTDRGVFIIQGYEKVLLIQESRLQTEPYVTRDFCMLLVKDAKVPVIVRMSESSVLLLDTSNIHKDIEDNKSIGMFQVFMLLFMQSMDNFEDQLAYVAGMIKSYCMGDEELADMCMIYVFASNKGAGGIRPNEHREIIRWKMFGGLADITIVATLVSMIVALVKVFFRNDAPSDRDDYALKCLKTPGNIVYTMFKQCVHSCKNTKNIQFSIEKNIYGCLKRGDLKIAGRVYGKMAVQLSKRSSVDALSSVRKVVVPCDDNSPNIQMRQIHASQRGYICPCETPEGKSAGITKSLACCCLVSRETDMGAWLASECLPEPFQDCMWVILDGAVVGWCRADVDASAMKHEYPTASITKIGGKILKIRTCAGRPLRPLLVVRDRPFDWNEVRSGRPGDVGFDFYTISPWSRLSSVGLLEYVDPVESRAHDIASVGYDYDWKRYKYIEIHPATMLGFAASTVPFPEHNQSARNVFSSSMTKQAMQMRDCEKICHTLQRPLVYTTVGRLIGLDENPNGLNLVVAVMSVNGFNQEDAIIVKKSAVDRGMFSSVVKSTTTVTVDNPWHMLEIEGRLYVLSGGVEKTLVEIHNMYLNAKIVKTKETMTESGKCKIDITMQEHRQLRLGDKLASRHAQKGVVGMLMNEEDMPFTESGMTPDVIINPHAVPSRMTVGQLLESILGKAASVQGTFADGTPFVRRDMKTVDDVLRMSDTETVTLGTTGEVVSTPIAMGLVYYMPLKHQAADKVYVRSSGPKSLMSRQPISGRSKGGGLRFGEMEYDCLVAHGAAKLATQIAENSDMIDVPYCETCETVSDVAKCKTCDADTVTRRMPFSYVVLKDLMLSTGVCLRV